MEGEAGDDGLVAGSASVFLPAGAASRAGLAAWRGRRAYRVSQSCEEVRHGRGGDQIGVEGEITRRSWTMTYLVRGV